MFKLSLTLGGLAICNAILAVLTPWYIATRLGVGIETDAFFASGALPQLVFLVVSYSLTQVLVPILTPEDDATFRRDAWGFFLAMTGFFSLLAVILWLTAGLWVSLLVPGFSVQAKVLAITLTRIQLFAMIGNACVPVLWAVYYARQKFVWTEASAIFANVVSLIFLIWTLPHYRIVAAAWAAVLNLALKMALLLPALGRFRWPKWDSYAMREAWRRTKPFLFGQIYSRTDPLVDRFLTSLSFAGNLSLLYIAQQIYSAINLVINKALSSPTVPKLAAAAKADQWSDFRKIYRQRLLWVAGLSVSAAIALVTIGEPTLHLMIGHGGITGQNVHMVWWIMIALIGLLAGGSAGQVTAAAFYSMGDTKTPTTLFIFTFTIYIPIKVLMFRQYGLVGLALTISAHLVLNFLVQLIALERAMSLRHAARANNYT